MSFLSLALYPKSTHNPLIVVCTTICKCFDFDSRLFVISFLRNSILPFWVSCIYLFTCYLSTLHFITWPNDVGRGRPTSTAICKCNLSPAGMNGYGIVINLIVPITMRVQSIFAHSANNKIRGCTSFDPLCEKLLHLTVIRVMSAHYTKYLTIPITQSQ